MQFTKLVKFNLDSSEATRNKLETVFVEPTMDKLIVKTKKHQNHLNQIVHENRNYFLGLIRDNGAGFLALERTKDAGVFSDLASFFRTGKSEGVFDYTYCEFKPADYTAYLRIAELFDWFTNVKSAQFEVIVNNKAQYHTVTGLINILNAIDDVEDYKTNLERSKQWAKN